jgi:hypothetical protein
MRNILFSDRRACVQIRLVWLSAAAPHYGPHTRRRKSRKRFAAEAATLSEANADQRESEDALRLARGEEVSVEDRQGNEVKPIIKRGDATCRNPNYTRIVNFMLAKACASARVPVIVVLRSLVF